MTDELELVDLRTSHDVALLEALYEQLFVPSFPDPDEQEGPEDWQPRLWGEPEPPNPQQHGFVAGTHLQGPDRELAGFAFIEHYRASRCGLLSYIAVDPRTRGHGVGRLVFERALASARRAADADGRPLRTVFAEIHDPRRVGTNDDVIDPATRVRIMSRLGGLRVPVTYVQPALGPDGKPSDRLMLIAFPLDGTTTLEADVVLAFLDEYYRALGIDDPTGNPDLQRVARELTSLGAGPVELVPLAPD